MLADSLLRRGEERLLGSTPAPITISSATEAKSADRIIGLRRALKSWVSFKLTEGGEIGELIRLHDNFPTFKTWYFRGTVVIAC